MKINKKEETKIVFNKNVVNKLKDLVKNPYLYPNSPQNKITSPIKHKHKFI